MKIEYDTKKNEKNISKHGFSLNVFELLDFSQAVYLTDDRKDYSEERYRVFAPLNGRLCVAVFTIRHSAYRVISLRKANKKERNFYEAQK